MVPNSLDHAIVAWLAERRGSGGNAADFILVVFARKICFGEFGRAGLEDAVDPDAFAAGEARGPDFAHFLLIDGCEYGVQWRG